MNECLLCRRDMKVSNNTFGNGCIKNIYSLLDMKMPKKVKYREEKLSKNIMKLTSTYSINKNQKLWLTERYLTYQYLNKIQYGNYNKIKNQIKYDIQNIKQIKKDEEPKSAKSMSLKQAYDLYKKVMKFQNGIDKISKCKNDMCQDKNIHSDRLKHQRYTSVFLSLYRFREFVLILYY